VHHRLAEPAENKRVLVEEEREQFFLEQTRAILRKLNKIK